MRQPLPFGKYLLLERISVGGMAEVFKAKAFGVEGFEKIIAIKRILPSMAEDADFIQMFIDEAKICGQLNHANICQTFELGRIEDSHFIAMEYIWGKDLLQIQNRFRRMRKSVPPLMAAFVASKVCEGLDYAHRKKDATGKPLGIIHRDVSPQNILCSYEGEIKVIDFGIAKAASRSSKTQAGVLKGKFGYMSPEHVRGMELDRRADIFSIGTILYEMLTNERLFLGESDFATLEKIRNVAVPPPSTVNPEVPPTLDGIIMKALAREVEDRYQWASEMQEALQNYLFAEEPVYGSKGLSQWMKEQFSAEMRREAQLLEEQRRIGREAMSQPGVSRSMAPPSTRLRSPTLGSGIPIVRPPTMSAAPVVQQTPAPPPADSDATPVPDVDVDLQSEDSDPADLLAEKTAISQMDGEDDTPDPADLPAQSTQILDGSADLVEAPQEGELQGQPTVVFAQGNGVGPQAPPMQAAPPHAQPQMQADPQMATLHAGPPPSQPFMAQPAYPPGFPIHHPQTGAFLAPPPPGHPAYGTGALVAVPPPSGMLHLPEGYPASMSGVYVPPAQPAPGYPARPGALWKDILVGVAVAVTVVVIVLGVKFLLSPPKGTIILTVFPPSLAEIQLDGKSVGRVQQGDSLLLREVPQGLHKIRVLAGDLEGQQQVSVTSAEPLQIKVHLGAAGGSAPGAPQRPTGVLKLRLPPDGALVSVDGRAVTEGELGRGYPVAADTPHKVLISKAGKRDQQFSVTVPAGGVIEREVQLEAARGRLTVASEPGGADVSVNGQSRGKTPLTLEDLDPNKPLRISLKRRGYANFVKYITFSGGDYEQSLDVKLSTGGGKAEERDAGSQPVAQASPPPQKAEPTTSGEDGFLVANTKPWARVFIDGKDTNRTTPIAPRDRIPLRPGRHTVTFVANQKKYNFDIVIKPGEEKKLIQELGDGN